MQLVRRQMTRSSSGQDEPVVHFGLAQNQLVDRLEIRWPSGTVDILEDIPADQRIRRYRRHGRFPYHATLALGTRTTRHDHSQHQLQTLRATYSRAL